MAVELILHRINQTLVPADQASADEIEKLRAFSDYRAVLTQARNLPFHRKFFALLDVAYEAWDPEPVEYRGQIVEKNKERFRKDLIILAGFGEPTFTIKGDVRYEAKSISFARMSQEDFEALYSKVVDVILRKVLTSYTKDDLERVVEEILGFA